MIPIEYLTGNIDIAKQPIEYLLDEEEINLINKCLLTLTPKEERIIRLRYGLYNGKELTLQGVGDLYKLSRERIRNIEAKALRKLRHPKNTKLLREISESKYKERFQHYRKVEARHYLPAWKKPIINHVHRYFHRAYWDFDFRRFYQGKMTTTELQKYFDSKEGSDL